MTAGDLWSFLENRDADFERARSKAIKQLGNSRPFTGGLPLTTEHCDLAPSTANPAKAVCHRLTRLPSNLLGTLNGWAVVGNEIAKTYWFRNYYETIAFRNATAWISHQENHHPDLEVGFRECISLFDACHRRFVGKRLHLRREDRRTVADEW